jgi:hypothetical protein
MITLASLSLLVAAQTPAASAASGLFVGVSDDAFEWNTAPMAAASGDLGLRAVRVALNWTPGQRSLSSNDLGAISNSVFGSHMRVVVAAFNQGDPPLDDGSRDAYCSYLANVVQRFPQINDLVIWNEPNLSGFWRPQFGPPGQGAPEQYEALLAHCYDVLHGLRSSINVIAPATSVWGNDNPNAFDNISHSPTTFIQGIGAAYRASGRTAPLFDTLGHHPYPTSSNERPWTAHADPAIISIGDLPRLVSTIDQAFGGTAQKVLENGLPLWYLETGYQTTIAPSKSQLYFGVETWPGAVPDIVSPEPPAAHPPDTSPAPDQATQLLDELRTTYCQPYVAADFNFMLEDEPSLGGWQSGLLWADGTRKGSYDAFKAAVAQVNAGTVDCSQVAGAPLVPTAGKPGAGSGTSPATPAKAPPKRSITKVTYLSSRRATFGFLRLRARLTRGVAVSKQTMAGRQLLFVVGKTGYLATTNHAGIAQVMPQPPLPVGRARIAIRFQGDPADLGSGLHVTMRIVNSPALVQSKGTVSLGDGRTLRLRASSDGKKASGTLLLGGFGPARSIAIHALGLRGDAAGAYLRGTDAARRRYLIHLVRLPSRHTRIDVVGGVRLGAVVPSGRLTLVRR